MTRREQLENYRTREFRDMGFKCIQPTEIQLPDGTTITLKADSYLRSRERDDDTDRSKRALKLYSMTSPNGNIELIDELDLEACIGIQRFNELS